MEVYHMPKQTDKELGLFFKNARHEQKLTYEELAEKAEMSSRYLKEIENGGRVFIKSENWYAL